MRLLRPDGSCQNGVPFRGVMGLPGWMLFLVDFVQLELGLLCQRVLRVDLEKLLELILGLIAIDQVVAVDLTLGEEGGEAVLAGRILQAQEFVLADGVVEESFGSEKWRPSSVRSSATAKILASALGDAGLLW